MNYKLSRLDNGLQVISVPLPSLESATITVWVRVGSRFEEDKIAGISHFLEHMVFKGTKKRPSAKAISEAVDAIGAEFNASTSKEITRFYIKCRSGVIETAFDVLSDMILAPLLKAEDLEKEKGVIVEEIGMYEDTPMAKIGDVFENVIFGKTWLGRDIIGSRKTVKAIKRKDFEDYIKKHFYTDNILLTVSGGVSDEKVMQLSKKYFGSLKKNKVSKYPRFINSQKKPQILLYPKEREQAHLILGYMGFAMGRPTRYAETVLSSILGGGMSSRMFTEVREKRGLAYAVRTSADHYMDTGYMATYAGIDPKKIDQVIEVIIDQYKGIADGKHPIKSQELKKAKEYIKGHLALSLEDTKGVNTFFGTMKLLVNKIETPDEVYKRIDKVTVNDVYDVAKKIVKTQRLNLAIIGPYKNKARFEKLLV